VTKAEKTREFILERTAPLFNCKGYAGTSLTDLTEVTGLTKGALYGNFASKEDIALDAFRYAMTKVKATAQSKIGNANTCREKLLAMLEFYSEYVFRPPVAGGCPLLNAAVQVDDDQAFMKRIVVKELMQTVEFIEDLLSHGIIAGEFNDQFEPKDLAYIFFCSIEGALMFSRAERSVEPMEIIIRHCKNLLDQITIKK
jgi:AcrR family transcriptional regulator